MEVERENIQTSVALRMRKFIYHHGTNIRRMIEAVVRSCENGTSLIVAWEHSGDDIG